jgi:hypothetical protein
MTTKRILNPLQYDLKQVSELLGLSTQTARNLANAGVFTVTRTGPAGPARRIYVPAAEVRAYAAGGLEALAKLRARKRSSSRQADA